MANKIPKISDDSFYVKRENENQSCKFAFLHLSDNASEIYLALFENWEVEEPIVYWWNEDEVDAYVESRRVIVEFIGEVYLSLYIKHGLEKPTDKPLWKIYEPIDCRVPSKWLSIVHKINRFNYFNYGIGEK